MQTKLRYNNLEVKRFSLAKGQINVNNNSTVTQVVEKEGKLEISFVFTSNYEPNVGLIKIEGELLVDYPKKDIKKIVKEWEKSGQKTLPKDVAEGVHNTILANCVVEATILSREVHLPAPIPTPRVSLKEKKEGEAKLDYIR